MKNFRIYWMLLGCGLCCQAQTTINAITNAASYSARISPGTVVTIFGTGFTNSPDYATDVPLPLSLGGVDVVIDGYSSPMLYVDQYQINFIVPYEVPAGIQSLTVQSSFGGNATTPVQIDVASPGLFQYSQRAFASNYPSYVLNSPTAPAPVGTYIIVYLTGIGPLDSTPADGDAALGTTLSNATSAASATIGGINAPLAFLGLAPGYVGLAQANVQVPQLPTGEYPLTITVNGTRSTSAIVSVSGTGTPYPNALSYLSVVGIPTSTIQTATVYPATVSPNGNYVYVCDKDQISAVNVSNPAAPTLVSTFGQDTLAKQYASCSVSQNYLLYLEGGSVLSVYDLASSPTQPSRVVSPFNLQIPGAMPPVFASSTTALLSTSGSVDNGTQIQSESGYVQAYDFSNFANPVFASTFNPTTAFTGNNAPRYGVQYLTTNVVAVMGTTNTGGDPTTGQGQFTVLDTTNPTSIQPIVEVPVTAAAVLQASALEGSLALIAGNTQALDTTIFADPITGAPEFLFSGDLTLTTVDFSNVDSPVVLSSFDTGIQSSGVPYVASLGGGFYAVSIAPASSDFNGPSTLAVVDATDAQHPAIYPFADIEGLTGLAVQSGILYATSSAGVTLYSIAGI